MKTAALSNRSRRPHPLFHLGIAQSPMRYLSTAVLAFTLVLVAACDGGSPTDPGGAAFSSALSTQAGSMGVVSHGCGEGLDIQRMRAEVETTAFIADRQNPDLQVVTRRILEGFELHARTPDASARRCDGGLACFEPTGAAGRLHVWCDGGGVEHETAHAIAYAARLPCWETVYHGHDFRCQRVR